MSISVDNINSTQKKKPTRLLDLEGERFGRLLVVEYTGRILSKSGKSSRTMWLCKCDCGNEKIISSSNLVNGTSKSCGCIHKEFVSNLNKKHGLSNKCGRLYPLWKSIKYRCYCKSAKEYKNYGGRGIVMCDEWKNDFKAFYDWAIANGYKEEKTEKGINILTIDRIDVNGNYEPSNCRFITNAEQAKNKRDSIPESERYKVCPVCNKEYMVKKRNGPKTCSQKCGKIYYFMKNPNTKDYTKICPICNKEYDAKRGGHYKDAKYCSRECASLAISPIWEYNGESHRVVEWAKIVGINAHCLLHRKEIGWSIEEILTVPFRGKRSGL